MTVVGWIAVLGPILAGLASFGIGLAVGVRFNAAELGELGERCKQLGADCEALRAQVLASRAAPPTRGESRRVLDLVASPNS